MLYASASRGSASMAAAKSRCDLTRSPMSRYTNPSHKQARQAAAIGASFKITRARISSRTSIVDGVLKPRSIEQRHRVVFDCLCVVAQVVVQLLIPRITYTQSERASRPWWLVRTTLLESIQATTDPITYQSSRVVGVGTSRVKLQHRGILDQGSLIHTQRTVALTSSNVARSIALIQHCCSREIRQRILIELESLIE